MDRMVMVGAKARPSARSEGILTVPPVVPNLIGGSAVTASETIEKFDPATGKRLYEVTRSGNEEVLRAVGAARAAQQQWAELPAVRRGEILLDVTAQMRAHRSEIAEIVHSETGKSRVSALGEVDAAIALGVFFAGEGQRLYGRTTTSGVAHKQAMTIREPIGVAGLIIAANTPIANVAWKVFPALICGNAAVLKAAEDAPATAWAFGVVAREAALPDGVLNVIQGLGKEAGAALVRNPDVGVVSFTGSTAVGREIAVTAGQRLARVSLELGGKNPFIVCDDADLDHAVKWAVQSAFSNAGQRCAAGSRIIVFESVYDRFRQMLVAATEQLSVGTSDTDAYGPVINERQLSAMLGAVERARSAGAVILTGGYRLSGPRYEGGYFLAPTLIENLSQDAELTRVELFGPIASLYRVADYQEAIRLANDSPYGLTACIHTRSIHRALDFTRRIQAGVAVVNAGTFGSEPHMPFGGVKQSGNGSREPGTEALDVYSTLKDVYLTVDPAAT